MPQPKDDPYEKTIRRRGLEQAAAWIGVLAVCCIALAGRLGLVPVQPRIVIDVVAALAIVWLVVYLWMNERRSKPESDRNDS